MSLLFKLEWLHFIKPTYRQQFNAGVGFPNLYLTCVELHFLFVKISDRTIHRNLCILQTHIIPFF